MPKVTVQRDDFLRELDVKMTDEEFEDLCFEFGLELDEISTEKGPNGEDVVYYKIEVAANRYDLLCFEGLSQALKVFLGKQAQPEYSLSGAPVLEMTVNESTKQVRPFVVSAVLRNISFTEASYKSFIELQEKLHQNICRKRTLVAIGTHDLDTLKGPFTYTAVPPSEIKFKALNQEVEMTAPQLMEMYLNDIRMKAYVPIILNSPVYPLILDSNGVVLSLPPIINGDHSKITLNTKNVLIECTAIDQNKADIVLNTILAAFTKHTTPNYIIEPVRITYNDHEEISPKLLKYSMAVEPSYVNSLIGINIDSEHMQNLLKKMGVNSKIESNKLLVDIPITRTDILHPCDIAEDIGISYGYNKIHRVMPKTSTTGKELPLNLISDLLRNEVALAGYTEALTFILHSFNYNYAMMRKEVDNLAVEIGNPKALEFQIPRTTLLPGVFRTISNNTKQQLPIKVFELSDVVLRDENAEVGARNNRRLAAGYCGNTSGLENVHGLLDVVMKKMGFRYRDDYLLEPSEDSSFFPKRQAYVVLQGKRIGILGIVHPEVLESFGINFPVSALEVDVEVISELSKI